MFRPIFQQPVVSRLNERYVRNFDEFLSALNDYSNKVLNEGTTTGKIIFIDNIVATRQVYIKNCSGLTIDGNSFDYRNNVSEGATAFNVQGPFVSFKDFFCTSGEFNWFRFIELGTSASYFTLDKCWFEGASLLYSINTTTAGRIFNCTASELDTAPWIYLEEATGWAITGNYLPGNTLVSAGSNTTQCVISGNIGLLPALSVGINTNLSAGYNVIVGNAGVQTITNAATDSVGLNT